MGSKVVHGLSIVCGLSRLTIHMLPVSPFKISNKLLLLLPLLLLPRSGGGGGGGGVYTESYTRRAQFLTRVKFATPEFKM
jgi:hypothetical protein